MASGYARTSARHMPSFIASGYRTRTAAAGFTMTPSAVLPVAILAFTSVAISTSTKTTIAFASLSVRLNAVA